MDFVTTEVFTVEHCDDLLVIRLRKPPGYAFKAGQWFRVRLDTEAGEQTRVFSHAAAPADKELVLATRESESDFKRTLARVSDGESVGISASGGRLMLPAGIPVTFLVGGVGITPVRSLVRDAIVRGVSMDGWSLFYGNRDFSCVPFASDLEAFERAGLRVIHVLEQEGGPPDSERGFITAAMIERHTDSRAAHFLIAGPPAMVTAMRSVLDELEVPDDRRSVESFGPTTSAMKPQSPVASVGNKRL